MVLSYSCYRVIAVIILDCISSSVSVSINIVYMFLQKNSKVYLWAFKVMGQLLMSAMDRVIKGSGYCYVIYIGFYVRLYKNMDF